MIGDRIKAVLAELPAHVELVAAAKTRRPEEVLEAVAAGAKIIGENYVQEAEAAQAVVGRNVRWHFIGHLQTNKVKKAVEIFDLIETVDSLKLGREIDRRSRAANRVMPVLIEINSGREPQKFGVMPEETEALIRNLTRLPNIRVEGLMTMGPETGEPEDSRPYFRVTRELFDRIASLGIPGVAMTRLSMGMSHSYRVAVEEGATIVRLGTILFGPRPA
ncbi:MAG: YggS family pyridoxal phosphate-dependent enzyme [Candidatus Aminicenantes bacterium]|nr:YggS family pyridoxal phosphate-dependent enzyme [Candidatus Aminicenantes bacterium]